MKDLDCDVCYPDAHVGCTPQPYIGAAPMGSRSDSPGTHYRCSEHRG